MFGLSYLAERITLASMAALLLPVQVGDIWRVRIAWPNGAVHYFWKFTSERDAIDWVNAHSNLTEPVAIKRELLDADRSW